MAKFKYLSFPKFVLKSNYYRDNVGKCHKTSMNDLPNSYHEN